MKYKKEISQNIHLLYQNRHDTNYAQTYLYDYVLYNIYSPAILDEIQKQNKTLPGYVRKSIPEQIQKLADSSMSTLAKKHSLDLYFVEEGVRILSAYASCPMPLSEDPNTPKKTRDLLSAKGKKRLEDLKRVRYNLSFDLDDVDELNEFSERAFLASNKFMLDLDLFVSFNHLNSLALFKDTMLTRNVAISMSQGCYNDCCHCAYEAKAPVSHMPYPMLLKLHQQFYSSFESPRLYLDSDPISYSDPMIGADAGDVVKYLTQKGLYHWVSFVSKGALTPKDRLTFAKVFESTPVELSFVALPGEKNVDQNAKRIIQTLQSWHSVPKDRRYHKPPVIRHHTLEKGELFKLEDGFDCGVWQPSLVGKWLDTVEQNGLQDRVPDTKDFSKVHTVIRPNGDIVRIRFFHSISKYDFDKVGHIFDPKPGQNRQLQSHIKHSRSNAYHIFSWQMD